MDFTTTKTKQRYYFLDNLKVVLTILVIVHHAGQPYGPTGGFWQFKSSLNESLPWLGTFFSINAGFFMGLFFLISGYFLPGSYDRKGSRAFLKDKLLRFLPAIFFAFFVMVPLEMYFYYKMYSGNQPLSFLQYYNIIYLGLSSKPVWFQSTVGWPELNFGHIWFLEHLLFYSLLYWLGRKLFSRNIKRSAYAPGFGFLILLACIITVITAIVREWYPIDKWTALLGIIQVEAAHLPQYAILFITGVFSYRYNLFISISKKVGYISLLFGAIMAVNIYVSRMFLPLISLIYSQFSIYESFMAVFLCWGLIVLMRENFNSTTPLAGFLAEHSFAAYIFHFPIVLTLQYFFDRIVIIGALGKFITVSLLAIVITYAFCYCLRKLPYISRII